MIVLTANAYTLGVCVTLSMLRWDLGFHWWQVDVFDIFGEESMWLAPRSLERGENSFCKVARENVGRVLSQILTGTSW